MDKLPVRPKWFSHLLIVANAALAGALMLIPAGAQAQEWVERSNANTQLLIDAEAQFVPEEASYNGVSEYDGLASDLGPDLFDRKAAAESELIAKFRDLINSESDPRVRQDLQILITKLERNIEGAELQKQHMLNWIDLPELAFDISSQLLSDQTAAERRPKALELVQRYTGLYPGSTSLFEQARAIWAESQGAGKVGPYRGQVEDALGKFPIYVSGIRELFNRYEIAGADKALAELDRQVTDYSEWTRQNVLPKARADFRLPPAVYAFSLKQVGINSAPEDLIARAKVEFYETRAAMNMLAPHVAKKFGFKDTDYRAVIHELKKDQIPEENLQATYVSVLSELEKQIAGNKVVALPDYPVKMRLATPGETASNASPRMLPPPLVGNTGQQGVFLLTTGAGADDGSALAYDDFSFKAASWTLSAHEGRPGHELQYATMVDRGMSYARALYAFNSVNVEGWALYAEAEMVPYEPIEGQFIALQHRLLRAARAFIDPMLNLGQMSKAQAEKILSEDVVLSTAMVKQEVDRYTFVNPGQAGSYFYGYSKLLDLRVSTELALGDKFNRKAFNDFILAQGLLPPEQVAAAVEQEFIPTAK